MHVCSIILLLLNASAAVQNIVVASLQSLNSARKSTNRQTHQFTGPIKKDTSLTLITLRKRRRKKGTSVLFPSLHRTLRIEWAKLQNLIRFFNSSKDVHAAKLLCILVVDSIDFVTVGLLKKIWFIYVMQRYYIFSKLHVRGSLVDYTRSEWNSQRGQCSISGSGIFNYLTSIADCVLKECRKTATHPLS